MRKIRFFRQHGRETCGISCILMLLYYFGRVKYPTVKQEEHLYSLYRCRALKMGTMASAAAQCLMRNRLAVSVFHSSPNYMENRDRYFSEPVFQAMLQEYRETMQAVSGKVYTETGFVCTADWYRCQLDHGKKLMVEVGLPGETEEKRNTVLHWNLLYGYEGDSFLICDPIKGKKKIGEEAFLEMCDTVIGSICITVGE